jgi:hypothetical protein
MNALSTLLTAGGLFLVPLLGQAQTVTTSAAPPVSEGATPAVLECLILTGRVSNAFNAPMSGATVLLRGTNLAYSTNSEGKYVLTSKTPLPRNTMLQISAAGYTTVEIPLTNCTPLDISLELLPGTKLKSDGRIKKTSSTGKIR